MASPATPERASGWRCLGDLAASWADGICPPGPFLVESSGQGVGSDRWTRFPLAEVLGVRAHDLDHSVPSSLTSSQRVVGLTELRPLFERACSTASLRPQALRQLWRDWGESSAVGPFLVASPTRGRTVAVFDLTPIDFARVGRGPGAQVQALERGPSVTLYRAGSTWRLHRGGTSRGLGPGTAVLEGARSEWRFLDRAGLLREAARHALADVTTDCDPERYLRQVVLRLAPALGRAAQEILRRWGRAPGEERSLSELLVAEGILTRFTLAKIRSLQRGLLDVEDLFSDLLQGERDLLNLEHLA